MVLTGGYYRPLEDSPAWRCMLTCAVRWAEIPYYTSPLRCTSKSPSATLEYCSLARTATPGPGRLDLVKKMGYHQCKDEFLLIFAPAHSRVEGSAALA